jgi:DNA-binding LytR/AlgR family response regulator
MRLTALIVDEECLARAHLRHLLEAQEVRVLGEAENASEARDRLDTIRPDLLLADVQMPGESGIELARELTGRPGSPQVIFVTGFSEYAVNAFEQNALDYLLKPVSAERLAITLKRAQERLASRPAPPQGRESSGTPSGAVCRLRALPVRADFAVRFLPLSSVLCVVARDKKVYACTQDGEYRALYTLTQLESMLPDDQFLRIHESSVVNLDAIRQLDFLGDHAYEICLSNSRRLRVGRMRYAELQRRIGLAPPSAA